MSLRPFGSLRTWYCLLVILACARSSLSSAQTIDWVRQFGSTSSDEARGVAADGSNVYVAGTVIGALPGQVASGGNDGATSLALDGKLGTSLGGATVTVNNTSAPLFYSTPSLLGIQIPFEVADPRAHHRHRGRHLR